MLITIIILSLTVFTQVAFSQNNGDNTTNDNDAENDNQDGQNGNDAENDNQDGEEVEVKHIQMPFVRNGGVLNQNEHALILYADADVLPPAIMLQYQYGLIWWMSIGLEIGGDLGVFQAMMLFDMEMFKTRNNFFFWEFLIRTGYKYHNLYISEDLIFDDLSWVLSGEMAASFRLGKNKRHNLYYKFVYYVDFDLRGIGRQIDHYITPVMGGYEVLLPHNINFFIEIGWMYSINGQEVYDPDILGTRILYAKSGFPVGKIGIAIRLGDASNKHKEHLIEG